MQQGADQVLSKPAPLYRFVNAIKNLIEMRSDTASISVQGYRLKDARRQMYREMIARAMGRSGEDLQQTADLLGVSTHSLRRLMARMENES